MSASVPPAPSARSFRTNSLSEGVLILLALTIVQRLVGFLRGILFCRTLDVDQLGQWDLAFSFLMLAAPLAVFGLPGSFGRYVETYRTAGQLRAFLRRTTWASAVPSVLFCLVTAAAAPRVAEFIFGDRAETSLVRTMAGALAALIAFNFLTCFFTALRAGRIVSFMQFSNTLLFAVLSLLFIYGWEAGAEAGVAAFGIACFISSAVSLIWMVRLWRELPALETPLGLGTLWAKLMPFAFWVWVTNWIYNSFEIADRYMIVHFGGLDAHEALDLVGQYHSARIIPALFLGLADLLSTWITPHLIGDWETGRRDAVAARLRLILKLFTLTFLGGASAMLIASPLFFHTALADKFDFAQEIFPWTLACSLWTGMLMISQNWLWCAEKSRLVCIGLLVGLLANVGLNLWLLPAYGLSGVVVASAATRLLALIVLWLLCRALGMGIDRKLVFVAILPGVLMAGPWWTLAVAALAASGLVPACSLFTADERTLLLTAGRKALAWFERFLPRRRARAAS